jgi:transcriptional regulator of acetoin/glycerol metabolism
VGVLDASSYYDSRQHHTHALVQMAATQIENRLLMQQMRQRISPPLG